MEMVDTWVSNQGGDPVTEPMFADLGRIVVVIPTYNERENLPLIVGRLRAAVPEAMVGTLMSYTATETPTTATYSPTAFPTTTGAPMSIVTSSSSSMSNSRPILPT